MNPYRRAATFVLRLIAFGLILFSTLQLGFYFLASRTGKTTDESVVWMVLKLLPLLIGLALLFGSSAIAKKLTEDFEE